jgi:hypothetical protein
LAGRDPIRTVLFMQRENIRRDDAGGRDTRGDRVNPALGAEVIGASSSVAGFLLPELAQLLTTAQKEITEHGNDYGLCPVCGSAFPCQRAVLADLALSAL